MHHNSLSKRINYLTKGSINVLGLLPAIYRFKFRFGMAAIDSDLDPCPIANLLFASYISISLLIFHGWGGRWGCNIKFWFSRYGFLTLGITFSCGEPYKYHNFPHQSIMYVQVNPSHKSRVLRSSSPMACSRPSWTSSWPASWPRMATPASRSGSHPPGPRSSSWPPGRHRTRVPHSVPWLRVEEIPQSHCLTMF